MFTPSREQARQLFFDAWRKYQQREMLSAMEDIALEVILLHPEYQRVLEMPERFQHKDYLPEMGDINPFLHMSMHIAVKEQLSIDQPPGIRASFEALAARLGSEHDAKHRVLECLGETIWQAQRTGTAPDQDAYLACIRKS